MKSTRGPKSKTVKNSHRKPVAPLDLTKIIPTSALGVEATAEFWRLVHVLDNRGTLDRVDLAVLTEAARVKTNLDQAYAINEAELTSKTTAMIAMLTSHRRGLLREMGLSITPSRNQVVARPKDGTQVSEPLAKLVKLADVS